MEWTESDVGKVCPTCARAVAVIHSQPGYVLVSCSNFCDEADDYTIQAWKHRKLGEFLVGPCGDCGSSLEGNYPGPVDPWVCSKCVTRMRLVAATEMEQKIKRLETDLEEAQTTLKAIACLVERGSK
jgi:endogenous inhibitor of DNA gyrase (YacG/DUF329 family)